VALESHALWSWKGALIALGRWRIKSGPSDLGLRVGFRPFNPRRSVRDLGAIAHSAFVGIKPTIWQTGLN
jgi:hypothetical protein